MCINGNNENEYHCCEETKKTRMSDACLFLKNDDTIQKFSKPEEFIFCNYSLS